MKHRILFIISLFFSVLHSQEVEFIAKVSKDKLGVNERLRIDFTMNKNGDNFTPPDFKGFTVVMGPSQSVSDMWMNGVRTFSKSFSYTLQPTAEGKFTIQGASIDIGGKTYTTKPVEISVTKAVETPSLDKPTTDLIKDNLFLVAEVSKGNPYLNEGISVIYKLYVGGQVALNDLRVVDVPKFPNFWSQEIRMAMSQYEVDNCTYQGKNFRCVTIKKMVLYPQKTGKITLEPLSVDAVLAVPTQQRDFFGRNIMQQSVQRVSSGNRVLNVRELPEEGKPDDFSGAVGDFTFEVNATRKELNASESTQIKVQVSGNGNLKLFDLPKLTFPSSLEVYNPEQKDNVNTTLSGMRGTVEQTYTIVPQYGGKYPVGATSFSYFNPSTQKYHTVKTEDILLDIAGSPAKEIQSTGEIVKQSVQNLGNQFRFLQLNPNLQPIDQPLFFSTSAYYWWLFLPLLAIPIALFWQRFQQKRQGDVEGNKIRKANRLAKKYLSEAKQRITDKDTFYEALERAFHNYLKAKLKIETYEMSKEKISSLLQEKQVKASTLETFISLLKSCELARYSQAHSVASLEKDYELSVQVLSELDKQIK
ncbi:BatD family protein [Capnocytophaga canis]|uniref:BatD family protein n=1 Tax=Capnocytophaga canis TaxID=1848903 RepID=UPI001561DC2B|nr:BatD family protein [Capnocytophaga canis]